MVCLRVIILKNVDTILPAMDRDYICDYLSSWEDLCLQKNKSVDQMFKFLFKRRNALHEPIEDLNYQDTNVFAFNIIFFQILYDIRFGKLPGGSTLVVIINSLQCPKRILFR